MLKVNKTSEYRGEIYANDTLVLYINASVANGQIQYMNQNIQDFNLFVSENEAVMEDFKTFQSQVIEDAQTDAKTVAEDVAA